MKRRTLAGIILLAVLVFSIGSSLTVYGAKAVGNKLPNPRVIKNRPLKVAYCRQNLAWASGIRPYIQMQIEGAKRGWEMTYVTDIMVASAQRNAVENLISKNVDAIIIDNFEIRQFPDLVLKARQKGIGVYCLDTPMVPGVIAETTLPNGIFSAEMAYWGLDKIQEKGGFCLIGYETTDWGVQRTFPIKILMEKCFPGIQFLAYDTPDNERYIDDSFQIASAWLQRFGKKIRWIHTPFDGIAMPVARAVEQAGFTRDDIMVTGIDAGIEACQMIKDGSPLVATYGQFFEAYAHYICEVIQEVQVEGIMPGSSKSMIPTSGIMRFPGILVDESNAPADGQTAYSVHEYDGLEPKDPEAWVNWYKQVNIKPYCYKYPTK